MAKYAMIIDMHNIGKSRIVAITDAEFSRIQREDNGDLINGNGPSYKLTKLIYGADEGKPKTKITPICERESIIDAANTIFIVDV